MGRNDADNIAKKGLIKAVTAIKNLASSDKKKSDETDKIKVKCFNSKE